MFAVKRRIILLLAFALGLELGLAPRAFAEPNDLVLLSLQTANLRTEKEILHGTRLPNLGPTTNAPKPAPAPDRLLIKVEFSSHVNLHQFAFGNGYITLASEAYFCDDPEAGPGGKSKQSLCLLFLPTELC